MTEIELEERDDVRDAEKRRSNRERNSLRKVSSEKSKSYVDHSLIRKQRSSSTWKLWNSFRISCCELINGDVTKNVNTNLGSDRQILNNRETRVFRVSLGTRVGVTFTAEADTLIFDLKISRIFLDPERSAIWIADPSMEEIVGSAPFWRRKIATSWRSDRMEIWRGVKCAIFCWFTFAPFST